MDALERPDVWATTSQRLGLICKTRNELICLMSIDRIFTLLKH